MKIPKPRKILVIQIRQMGDVLLTTPIVRALAQEFGDAQVDFLSDANSAQVLAHNPYIHEVVIYDKRRPLESIMAVRKRNYDWVLDFLGNPRSALITLLSGAPVRAGFRFNWRSICYNFRVTPEPVQKYVVDSKYELLAALGVRSYVRECALYLTDVEREEARAYLDSCGITKSDFLVCISPVSRRPARRWKPEHVARLCELLETRYGARILVLWGPGEESQIESVVRATQANVIVVPLFTLRQISALISHAQLVVANSNGPQHLAEALAVPSVTICGPTRAINWRLPVPWSMSIAADELSCIGCGAQVCPKQMECMELLTPERVLAYIEQSFPSILTTARAHAHVRGGGA